MKKEENCERNKEISLERYNKHKNNIPHKYFYNIKQKIKEIIFQFNEISSNDAFSSNQMYH